MSNALPVTPTRTEPTCLLCGAARPAPTGNTNWRSALVGDTWYHSCPAHFPPDGASGKAYEDAYVAFLRAAIQAGKCRP